MPWKCPACHDQIRHASFEAHPRPDAIYRCHICRIELILDPLSGKLIPVPLEPDEKDRKDR
jgi:hypothetical protein